MPRAQVTGGCSPAASLESRVSSGPSHPLTAPARRVVALPDHCREPGKGGCLHLLRGPVTQGTFPGSGDPRPALSAFRMGQERLKCHFLLEALPYCFIQAPVLVFLSGPLLLSACSMTLSQGPFAAFKAFILLPSLLPDSLCSGFLAVPLAWQTSPSSGHLHTLILQAKMLFPLVTPSPFPDHPF